jgi:hypothetical protein
MRGCDSISEYLAQYPLSISDVYYRAIESGKSDKALSVKNAQQLCQDLQDDEKRFFWHWLKDTLPMSVFDTLIKPVPSEAFGDFAEHEKILRHDADVYMKAMAKARLECSYVPNEKALALLEDFPNWLPLIHFIYMTDNSTDTDLEEICHQNGIKESVDLIIEKMKSAEIIREEKPKSKRKGRMIGRFQSIFRTPHNEKGQRLKDQFISEEVRKSLDRGRTHQMFTENESFLEAKIEAYSMKNFESIRHRILAVLAETAVCEQTLDKERTDIKPFFFSLIVSPREEYMPQKWRPPNPPD